MLWEGKLRLNCFWEVMVLVTNHKIELTSAEIANLWSNYMSDTSAICTIGSFLSHVDDTEIRSILEFAIQLSQAHVQKLQSIFTEEQHPIPDGFSVNGVASGKCEFTTLSNLIQVL